MDELAITEWITVDLNDVEYFDIPITSDMAISSIEMRPVDCPEETQRCSFGHVIVMGNHGFVRIDAEIVRDFVESVGGVKIPILQARLFGPLGSIQ